MRLLISVLIVVYLVGVGVSLSPIFQDKWNSAPASELVASVSRELPTALAWPARIYRDLSEREARV
ncbi:MAG: hypothetical protein JO234_08025 [Hyphomicrobiales bacterium]|nr:hypothetical protein [Hyphomicrobiales bacterium]